MLSDIERATIRSRQQHAADYFGLIADGLGDRPALRRDAEVLVVNGVPKLLDHIDVLEEFVRWLVSMDDTEDPIGMAERRSVTLTAIINRARGVLGETEG